MTNFIWMFPWDLEGREPDAVLDELEGLGLNAASLALAYHGGRMLLPRHPSRAVYEQHPGALYFPCDATGFGAIRPHVSQLSGLVPPFLEAAKRRGFPVYAWLVLCHNDFLGAQFPDCTIENAFGDRYSYALCPSHPAVRQYIVELCVQAAAVEGIRGLDLEALSYMGYDHASLHDKRGMTLFPQRIDALSLCFCRYCRGVMGKPADRLRDDARLAIRDGRDIDWSCAMTARRLNLITLLREVRMAVETARIHLRFTPDLDSHGGKTPLFLEDLEELADYAVYSFFRNHIDSMTEAVGRIPRTGVPKLGGFIFHNPDCIGVRDIERRLDLLAEKGFEGAGFYSYALANAEQLGWLRRALKGSSI